MKASTFNRYGSVDVLQLQELATPSPKSDEVLVKVMASSVNPVDWKIRRGDLRLLSGFKFPHLLGSDFAGTVKAIGQKVSEFQVGDEVYGSVNPLQGGACAEYVCVGASAIAPKPKTATFEQAAAIPVAGVTALQALRDLGRLQAGDRVLVNGASGGVGTFAVQIAKAFEAEVTGVCSAKNADFVRQLGSDRVLDYNQEDFTTQATPYNSILDTVGNRTFFECQKVLVADGTYITTLPSLGNLGAFLLFPQKAKFVLARPRRDNLTTLARLVDEGKVHPTIDRVYPLAEVVSAHTYSESHRAVGKIVITVP